MKKNAGCIFAFLLVALITPFDSVQALQASIQNEGKVTLQGDIVDSTCALDAVSAYQIVDMVSEPINQIMQQAESEPHSFQLRLVNCLLTRPDPSSPSKSLPDWQHLKITFDGPRDMGGRFFAVGGDSEGVALSITDSTGQESVPGEPMLLHPSIDGGIALNYKLRLVGNGRPMVAGTLSAAVRFKLEYY